MNRILAFASAAALVCAVLAPSSERALAQASTPSSTAQKIQLQYGFCFVDGQKLVYDKKPANGVTECAKRCEDDARCNAFEIWEHTLVCKLYSGLPQTPPRPQTVFPQNKTTRGEQSQAALGIKITRGF